MSTRRLQPSDPAASLLAHFPVQLLAVALLFQHVSLFLPQSLLSFHSAVEPTRERRVCLLKPFRANVFPHIVNNESGPTAPGERGTWSVFGFVASAPSF